MDDQSHTDIITVEFVTLTDQVKIVSRGE